MIVVDASALTNALTDDGPVGQSSRAELARDAHWAAPEHLAVEIFSAIRGLHLGGKISRQRALDALDTMMASHIESVGTTALVPRMWQLRDHLSGYDAAYVAAAETHGCPLVTADVRLARSGDLRCEVRLALPDD
ncbi:MAG: type II toxin-antitoxin system VapC family toxin [Actinomycetota bacterium]|nr:type II toxin-antitoxin system VapC family toxin [Actinomycetota bacterium]